MDHSSHHFSFDDDKDLYLILKEQFDLEILLKLREISVLVNEESKLNSILEIISTITEYFSKNKNLFSNSACNNNSNNFQSNFQNKNPNSMCRKCRYKHELNSLFLFRNMSNKKQRIPNMSPINCFENNVENGFPRYYLRSIAKEVYFNGDDSDEIIESDLVL